MRLTDTANTFAYNVGALVKPADNLKFGLTYRSRADLRFENADINLRGAFSASSLKAKVRPLTLPPVVDAAVFWQVTPNLGAEFVYEYTRWSEFRKFAENFTLPTFVPGAPIRGLLADKLEKYSTLKLGGYYGLINGSLAPA